MTVGVPRFAPVIAGPADMRVFGFPAAAERRPGGNGHRRGRRGHTRGTALGAAPDTMADVSIAQVPGIPPNRVFPPPRVPGRRRGDVGGGHATQDRYGNHFLDSPAWAENGDRGPASPAGLTARPGDTPARQARADPDGGRALFKVHLPPPDQPGVRERVVTRKLGGYQLPAVHGPVVHMVRDLRVIPRSFLAEVLIFRCHPRSVGLEADHVPRTGQALWGNIQARSVLPVRQAALSAPASPCAGYPGHRHQAPLPRGGTALCPWINRPMPWCEHCWTPVATRNRQGHRRGQGAITVRPAGRPATRYRARTDVPPRCRLGRADRA